MRCNEYKKRRYPPIDRTHPKFIKPLNQQYHTDQKQVWSHLQSLRKRQSTITSWSAWPQSRTEITWKKDIHYGCWIIWHSFWKLTLFWRVIHHPQWFESSWNSSFSLDDQELLLDIITLPDKSRPLLHVQTPLKRHNNSLAKKPRLAVMHLNSSRLQSILRLNNRMPPIIFLLTTKSIPPIDSKTLTLVPLNHKLLASNLKRAIPKHDDRTPLLQHPHPRQQ